MGTHKPFSPSKAERWMACPGGEVYGRSLPAEPAEAVSVYAAEGTAAHALLELCIREGRAPEWYRGRVIAVGVDNETELVPEGRIPKTPLAFRVEADMVEAVSVAYWYVQEAGTLFGAPEAEVFVNPLPGRGDTGGTADVILDHGDCLEVVDYKHGRGQYVAVEGNPQLLTYLVGAAERAGWSEAYTRYRATIIQPRFPGREAVRSEEVTAAALRAWSLEMAAAVERVDTLPVLDSLAAYRAHGALAAGEHCRWCPFRAECPEVVGMVQEAARADFAAEPPAGGLPAVEVDLERVLPHVAQIEAWCAAVKAMAHDRLSKGIPVAGWKLVAGRSTRRWKEGLGEADIERQAAELGVSATALFKREMVSGPAAEKLVPRALRQVFAETLLEKPAGKPVLAPESDKRPALAVSAADDFAGA